MSKAPGDSSEQQDAERHILDAVGQQVGVDLEGVRITLASGSWMELDGWSADPLVLCEAWAHIGKAKPAQQKKVMTDALKLVVARSEVGHGRECRAILAFCDEDAAARFQGKSWMAEALRQLEIDVLVVDIPQEVRGSVEKAQRRQYR